jgi:hypothetical protein
MKRNGNSPFHIIEWYITAEKNKELIIYGTIYPKTN